MFLISLVRDFCDGEWIALPAHAETNFEHRLIEREWFKGPCHPVERADVTSGAERKASSPAEAREHHRLAHWIISLHQQVLI